MKKLYIFLLLSLFLSNHSWAQRDIGFLFREAPAGVVETLKQETKRSIQNHSSAQVFLASSNVVKTLENGNEEFFLKIPHKNSDLELHIWPSQIYGPEFKVLNSAGEEVAVDLPTTYWGRLKGVKESFVTISIYNGDVSAIISSANHNLTVGKLENTPTGTHIIYNTNEIEVDESYNTDDVILIDYEKKEKDKSKGQRLNLQQSVDGCRGVEIFYEMDYQIYKDHGHSVSNTQAYLQSLFNNVAYLYEIEGVKVRIHSIKVWDTPDPYVNASSTSDALNAFEQDFIDNSFNNFPATAHLAHLATSRFNGGVAWLYTNAPSVYGGMTSRAVFMNCSKTDAMGVSGGLKSTIENFPNYSWNVNVLTHELGHNFGLPHTQSCTWPGGAIDGCGEIEGSCTSPGIPSEGGTIMSYCHNRSVGMNFYLGFGKMPGDKLRAEVAAASCLGGSPSTDAIVSHVILCSPGTTTLTATGCSGGDYKWYDNRFSITPLSTSSSYTTPHLSTTTSYYVSCTKPSDCEGNKVEVVVSIGTEELVAVDGAACGSDVVLELGASGCLGGTIKWYQSATGGSVLGTGNIFTTPPLSATTHYYAECDGGSCVSDRVKVSAVVDSGPCYCIPSYQNCNDGDRFQTMKIKQGSNTVYSMNNNTCNDGYAFNETDTISLKLSTMYDLELDGLSYYYPNGVVAWIDYNNNGEFEPNERILIRYPVTSSTALQSFVTPGITASDVVRMRVKVQYYTLPEDPCIHEEQWGDTQDFIVHFSADCDNGPLVSGSTNICVSGGSTILTVGCPTAKWYTKATGGTLIHAGSEFVTPVLNATTSYYVECDDVECTTPRTKVTVNYNPGDCENLYCDPESLRCDDDDMITLVEIKKGSTVILSNQTSCGGPAGYTYYNNTATQLEAGETYQITIENPGIYSEAVKAWIDFNGNGVFDSGEEIFAKGPAIWASETQSFTVPGNITSAEVRMRVKLTYFVSPEPCEQDLTYGETEDYLIQLINGTSPCPPVVTLASPADDLGSGTHLIQAVKTGGKINATNKISNSARATYEAASIQLNPGFEVKKGVVFTAKTGGCE